MGKSTVLVAGALGVLLVGYFFFHSFFAARTAAPLSVVDHKNTSYEIEGRQVQLANGKATTQAAPGSAAVVETNYFGNEARGDLNGDGREDIVFLLTQAPGGTGVFYYVVVALATDNGFQGSEAYLIGDRIAPQTTEIRQNSVIVVNFADRKPGEAMTAEPTVAKSTSLKLDPTTMRFGIVANHPGEADPSRMPLTMKTWDWVSALYSDGRAVSPQTPGVFSITFGADGKFTAKTDCNSMGGSYVADRSGKLLLSDIYATKMFCQGSQETEFSQLLANASGYHFTPRGELILEEKFDSGTATFK